MKMKFSGSIDDLKSQLQNEGFSNYKVEQKNCGYCFRFPNGSILNFWPSNGSVNLQGKTDDKLSRFIHSLCGSNIKNSNETIDEPVTPAQVEAKGKVFVVHGHDNTAREQLELILKEQEMKEDKCKEISRYYAEKSKETKDKKDTLKRIIMETMENLGVKKIETATGTFTIKKNAPALIIEDDKLIPEKFKTIVQETKIEKTEIKKALKDGAEIEGVRLESSQSLLVK